MLFLLMIVCSVLASFTGVWWSVVPMAFIAAMAFGKSNKQSFWSAFLANSLIWGLMITYRMVHSNNILLSKISMMLFLPHWSILVVITILIGGLSGGCGGLAGFLTRRYLKDLSLF